MLRRLLLVLCLTLAGMTAASPALAQVSEAELGSIADDVVAAGRPADAAIAANSEVLGLLLDGAGQANQDEVDDRWLSDWTARLDSGIAALEATLPALRPMTAAEIQRYSRGEPSVTRTLGRMNTIRASLNEAARQVIFFARECRAQAKLAAKGDEKARQRMVRIGVSSNRLTLESQVVVLEGVLASLPKDQPHAVLLAAGLANSRSSIEVFKLMERTHADEPLDTAGTVARIREQVAEARRQADLIEPAIQAQLRALKQPGTPPALASKLTALLVSYRPSADTERQIANLMEATALRIETDVGDPGEDAWGVDLTLPLEQKRQDEQSARLRMIQNF